MEPPRQQRRHQAESTGRGVGLDTRQVSAAQGKLRRAARTASREGRPEAATNESTGRLTARSDLQTAIVRRQTARTTALAERNEIERPGGSLRVL